MPTPTYIPLANITLGSSASSVTFSSIPSTYRDLVVVMSVQQNTTSARQVWIRPNGDSSNASLVYMDGGSGGPASGTSSNLTAFYVDTGVAANTVTTSITNIMDYSATDKHKTFLTRAGTPNPVSAYASRWASTSAITSLLFYIGAGGDYQAGSTFALYGIAS